MRREFTRFGKFALRIRIRAVHAFVASNADRLPATVFRESLAIPECFKANCIQSTAYVARFHNLVDGLFGKCRARRGHFCYQIPVT